MSDWKPGDLALAVKGGGACSCCGTPRNYQKGQIFTVTKAFVCPVKHELGLFFAELPDRYAASIGSYHEGYRATHFRKIEPYQHTEDDLEVIDLYKRTPEPADLQQVGASCRWVEDLSAPHGSLPTGGVIQGGG